VTAFQPLSPPPPLLTHYPRITDNSIFQRVFSDNMQHAPRPPLGDSEVPNRLSALAKSSAEKGAKHGAKVPTEVLVEKRKRAEMQGKADGAKRDRDAAEKELADVKKRDAAEKELADVKKEVSITY